MMKHERVNALELSGFPNAALSEGSPPLGERMDLVGHVKVKVTVALGSTDLTLGELFSLRGGEVLQLDREVDSPVDIRLHERLIARGQLVAAGNQFGVRITEILAE